VLKLYKPDQFKQQIISFNSAINNRSYTQYVTDAYELYNLLIEPVSNLINDVDELVIIPGGE